MPGLVRMSLLREVPVVGIRKASSRDAFLRVRVVIDVEVASAPQHSDRSNVEAPFLGQRSIESMRELYPAISGNNRKQHDGIAKHSCVNIERIKVVAVGRIDKHSYARSWVIAEATKLATRVSQRRTGTLAKCSTPICVTVFH